MLELSKGNTYTLTYNIKNSDNSIKDLTGTTELKYKLSFRVDSDPLIEYSLLDPEINITNPANGTITVDLSSTVLNALRVGTKYHELWHVNDLGDPTTLMTEKLKLNDRLIQS